MTDFKFTATANNHPGGYEGPYVEVTDVLRLMAEEVKACNIAKGWYETDPRVRKFERWLNERSGGIPLELMERIDKVFGDRSFGDDISLLHSEVSEMLEAFRATGDVSDQTKEPTENNNFNPKPEGVGAEAADVLVRLLDTCSRYDIDLFAEWRRKVNYNWTRPVRHGGKAL